jgi:PST family polysaccharide transporter
MIKIGSSLAINKLFAFFFGAAGITTLAHLQNLFGMVTMVPAEGVGRGLVKYMSDISLSKQLRRDFVLAGLAWHLLIWLMSGLVFLLYNDKFFTIFPSQVSGVQGFAVVFAAMLGQLLFLYGSALLLSAHKIRLYLISQIIASALVLGSVIIGISGKTLAFALVSFAVGQGLSVGVILLSFTFTHTSVSEASAAFWQTIQVYRQHRYFKRTLVALGKYSLMALSVVVFGKAVDFFVRQFAVQEFGMFATGLWQAVVRTSDLYTQVFTALLGIVYFPRIAAVIHQKEVLNQFLVQTLRIWLPLIILGLLGVFIMRYHLLALIFDSRFVEGAVFFKWQLPGDFFSMLSYFFAYIMLGKARIRLFVQLQAFSALLYLICIFLLYPAMGIEALAAAYFIRSAGYAICLLIFAGKVW